MSYTKKTWASGDTVTSAALNNIETGIDDLQNFVVTLTPTALDYSGTMDKTVAEIYTAYQAGKRILFKLITGENQYMDIFLNSVGKDSSADYPSFNVFISAFDGTNDMLVFAYTGTTSDGTHTTYSTRIYPTTPVS